MMATCTLFLLNVFTKNIHEKVRFFQTRTVAYTCYFQLIYKSEQLGYFIPIPARLLKLELKKNHEAIIGGVENL